MRKDTRSDTMKIATFNIWDSDMGMPRRQQQIIDEVKAVNADIICLQKVKEEVYNELVSQATQHQYNYYHDLDGEYTGLAVFSKFPIIMKKNIKCAAIITCEYAGNTYLIANVHLPWDSVMKKEQYIVDINKEIKKIDVDYAFLAGDFNSSGASSVHHYLTGQRTLLNTEAIPIWEDLGEVYSQRTKTKLEYTVDLINNPRWEGQNLPCSSERFDRIYIKGAFLKVAPELKSFYLFGKEVDKNSGYCASDHYGVVAEVIFG